ncbi:MAG: cell envelope integrity protein TolA [Candidatus Nitrotoga sp.]
MSEFVYVERYKLPAGILAVLVNGLFFAFIIFGVNWRVAPQPPMVVDIWESLPEMDISPVPVEPPLATPPKEMPEPAKVPTPTRPAPVKTVEPTLPSKAEIELAEKKKKEKEEEAQRKKKAEQEAKALKLKEAEQEAAKALKLKEAEQEAAKVLKLKEAEQEAAKVLKLQEAEQARVQSEKLAARNSIVNDYKARILAKIKSRIKWPEEGHITAVYEVTLLPDGSVLEIKLVKSSGNPAYDRQTEAAIESAQRLPLPPDQALFSQFRKIQLKFSPTE